MKRNTIASFLFVFQILLGRFLSPFRHSSKRLILGAIPKSLSLGVFFFFLKCMVVLCLIFCWILHPKVFMLFFVFHCIALLGAALFLLLPSFQVLSGVVSSWCERICRNFFLYIQIHGFTLCPLMGINRKDNACFVIAGAVFSHCKGAGLLRQHSR